MNMIEWNKLREKAHANSVRHGFWENSPSDQHFLCLVISELMEAVEADRKGDYAGKGMKKLFKDDLASGEDFKGLFESHLKDTVEDELADAAIRLLDLAGAHNLNLNTFCIQHVVTPRKTFTENIFAIVKDLVNYKYSQEQQVSYALHQIRRLSEIMKFDLEWHIEQKMLYNESREVKHGKKY